MEKSIAECPPVSFRVSKCLREGPVRVNGLLKLHVVRDERQMAACIPALSGRKPHDYTN